MSHQATIEKMASVWHSLIELCTPLTEAQWKTPTACPGWSVQDQIAHMLGSEERLLGRAMPQHTPQGSMEHVKNEMGKRNEIVVDWRRSWNGAQVLTAFREVTRERLAILRGMNDADFAAQTQTPIGPGTVSDLLQIRIFDAWVHEQDIRRAIQCPGHLDGPVAAHAVGRVAMALPYVLGRKVKAADGTVAVFVISGAAGQTVVVTMEGGRGKILATSPSTPTVQLTMDVETFTCLGCGRMAPAAALQAQRVHIEGERTLGTEIVAQMNIMI